MSKVAVVSCSEYELEELERQITQALSLLGDFSYLTDKKILIKPNFLSPNIASSAVTTHPKFILAVVRVLKRYSTHLYLGDSPGIGSLEAVLTQLKLKEDLIAEGVNIVEFSDSTSRKVNGVVCKQFTLAKIVDEVDYIISLPKLKTHGMTYYTGTIKNQFGLVPGLLKPKQHYVYKEKEQFAHMLLDLHLAVKPTLAIMDGVVAMEGNGPRNGTPRHMGVVLASRDLLALDSTACRMIQLDYMKVPYLKVGANRSLGTVNEKNIEVVGEPWQKFRQEKFHHISHEISLLDFIPFLKYLPLEKMVYRVVRTFFIPKPKLISSKCIGCSECEKVCPSQPKSIQMVDKKPKFSYKSCIRCFCCQEMCPVGALKAKKGL